MRFALLVLPLQQTSTWRHRNRYLRFVSLSQNKQKMGVLSRVLIDESAADTVVDMHGGFVVAIVRIAVMTCEQ
jgi:RNase P/RNase MRP subunit POP5